MNAPPSVRLISHASAIIEVDGLRVLTDPWLKGSAFNDSWNLLTEAADLTPYLDGIDYLWISHEHPDHFHIPSLRSLPEAFRNRVTVLFQQSSDHEKMVAALTGKLGFPNVRLLPHRRWVRLAPTVEVLCYQSRHLDSALAVRGRGGLVLNMNDCDMNAHDFRLMRSDFGQVDVLLNQFSLAGFDGVEANLPHTARLILDDMVQAHRALNAKVTIPFASFAFFSTEDNRIVNDHANTPADVARRFEMEGLDLAVLAPGDNYILGRSHDNRAALATFDSLYAQLATRPYKVPKPVTMDVLSTAFIAMRQKLLRMHGRFGLRLLKPVVVRIPDLDISVRMSFRDGDFKPDTAPAAVQIYSQPLLFMLSNDFGLQTLGVSGRIRLLGDAGNWFRHRALMGMLNSGIGLAPRQLFDRRQIAFLWSRRGDLYHQTRHTAGRVLAGIASHTTAPKPQASEPQGDRASSTGPETCGPDQATSGVSVR